jgi:hypothetical protein
VNQPAKPVNEYPHTFISFRNAFLHRKAQSAKIIIVIFQTKYAHVRIPESALIFAYGRQDDEQTNGIKLGAGLQMRRPQKMVAQLTIA